jgi:alpha-glucosidase
MAKVPGLPDVGHPAGAAFDTVDWVDNPHWDVDAVHDILRRFRKIADEYDDRMLVAEAVVNGSERLSRYVRAGEMHTSFNFDYLRAPWAAAALRGVIDASLGALAAVAAPATWVLSTHDDSRHLTRYSRVGPGAPADFDVGTRRARAAVLLTLALPGGAYLYQGEELGLPDVEDLPEHLLQDPTWERSGHTVRGRDACRVPLPWSRTGSGLGFAAGDAMPWLPQPVEWGELSVAAQLVRPDSMLSLYRAALAIRRAEPDLRQPGLTWLDSPDDVLIFDRGQRIRCVVNLSAKPHPLPRDARPLLASGPLAGEDLASDTAVWLAQA